MDMYSGVLRLFWYFMRQNFYIGFSQGNHSAAITDWLLHKGQQLCWVVWVPQSYAALMFRGVGIHWDLCLFGSCLTSFLQVPLQGHLESFNSLSFVSQHPCQDSLWEHLQRHLWAVSPAFQVLRLIRVRSLWSLLLLFQCPLLILSRSFRQKSSVSSTVGQQQLL